MTKAAAAARPATAYDAAFALAAPLNVAIGATAVPVQELYAAPVAFAAPVVARVVAAAAGAVHDENDCIHEVYRQ